MVKGILIIASFIFSILTGCSNNDKEEFTINYNNDLLQKVRTAAVTIPGSMPMQINYLKYAESIRKWSDIIEGGSDDPCKMARTAFQVEYPDGWIMIDAGMDRDIHRFFEQEKPQPFDDTKANIIRQAVAGAKLILITHEHGDHVGGVIKVANTFPIARKTILTQAQANTLLHDPQMPEIKLDEAKKSQYIITDFESILPVAPGIVLIKAPGHTKGEIIIYTRLQNGKEYLFPGDVSWSFKGIAEKKGKPKSEIKRVGENADLVEKQLSWLNELMQKENMTVLVSHDDIMLPQFAAQGLITDSLRTSK